MNRRRPVRSTLGHLAALMALCTVMARGVIGDDSPARTVSWWWTAPEDPEDPEVAGLLSFAKRNTDIISSIMMRCGVYTCIRNESSSRPHSTCLNNGGIGGKITGNLSEACLRVIPELTKLGITSELWLGEDDSYESALYLFEHADQTAEDLLSLASHHPAIKGFNIDLESGQSSTMDTERFAHFLGTVTQKLNAKGIHPKYQKEHFRVYIPILIRPPSGRKVSAGVNCLPRIRSRMDSTYSYVILDF